MSNYDKSSQQALKATFFSKEIREAVIKLNKIGWYTRNMTEVVWPRLGKALREYRDNGFASI